MNGHVIDGRHLLPATGYLALVWQTIGMMKNTIYTTLPIIFKDVNFIRATNLLKNDAVKLRIAIQKGTYRMINFSMIVKMIIIDYINILQMESLK